MENLTDDNINLIKQLVTVLSNSVTNGIPCNDQDKASLKTETETRVEQVKAKANDYIDDKNTKIAEAGAEVLAALDMIEAANEDLLEQNKSTIAAEEANFTLQTEMPTSTVPPTSGSSP